MNREPDSPTQSRSRSRSPWSPHHQRLHRHLLRQPQLLPERNHLLLAVSGGQDSMALTGLLEDLQRLHHWRLTLWHGDHGWRPESADQASALAHWAGSRSLELILDRADPAPRGEAAARRWRYRCLAAAAAQRNCTRVVTGHTASDRAETTLLNMARGSHRKGLGSLRALGPLPLNGAPHPDALLSRPLLIFARSETDRICRSQDWPIWLDPSNGDPRHSRNRLRAEVMPVLESLHPGASHRISAQAGRLAEEMDGETELLDLGLSGLLPADSPGGHSEGSAPETLDRKALAQLSRANQRRLLQRWLERRLGQMLTAESLEGLLSRLAPGRPPGGVDLPSGWRLSWNTCKLVLLCLSSDDG